MKLYVRTFAILIHKNNVSHLYTLMYQTKNEDS